MQPPVILSKREQEYLLRVIEGAHQVRDPAQLFLLAQGQLQALLPHRLMVCLQFGRQDALLRVECLHAEVLDEAERGRVGQLALRLARVGGAAGDDHLTVSTGNLPGGASAFVLLGMPLRPHARHLYFFELLLPHLHLALLRLADAGAGAPRASRPLSAREAEILHWLREGKSNHDIGAILGLSPLTVKNHLQGSSNNLGNPRLGEKNSGVGSDHVAN